ncbi:Tryptophan synthase beta chain [Seminavis robusta]|uniref:tryptophan synthase n=1 Tax=Seminavis robusta TaxID=568900 RepID=A0A9N8HA68_9STRA|nr:Tryptophan synthase beta chain [Seminavis robusta]|eukprot:Sro138_g064740.1 Tryptophan synthase beta chain (771) ;mRNA; f:52596-55003
MITPMLQLLEARMSVFVVLLCWWIQPRSGGAFLMNPSSLRTPLIAGSPKSTSDLKAMLSNSTLLSPPTLPSFPFSQQDQMMPWPTSNPLLPVLPESTGTERIEKAFARTKQQGSAAFVSYVTAGYPNADATPSILLAMERGGATLIELGMPYSDPQADGPTNQRANEIALERGTTRLEHCLDMLRTARANGLTVPVVLMGYVNPFLQYGSMEKLCKDTRDAGGDGFLIVDLPPASQQGAELHKACRKHGLSNIPLVTPDTSEDRIDFLAKNVASTFLYCVSVNGVTGARDELPDDLESFMERVRAKTDLPLAVGFGISTPQMVHKVSNIADAVVVGSAIVKSIVDDATTTSEDAVEEQVAYLASGTKQGPRPKNQARGLSQVPASDELLGSVEQGDGNFGSYGGQFVPECLAGPLQELKMAYQHLKDDPSFQAELDEYRRDFIGGPTPLQKAERLTELCGGATIWLKREDLCQTGSCAVNNVVGQALLAKRSNKRRIIADTASGQNGVAVATVCAKLGLDCTIYMGETDIQRDPSNTVEQMRALGATVVPVEHGEGKLKDAINEGMRDFVATIQDSYYMVGSVVGPDPFPAMVRDFQSVIGQEIRQQALTNMGKLPDAIVACVGRGSNAIGAFSAFLTDEEVALFGVEGHHCASLSKGSHGVFHGAKSYILQDEQSGQMEKTHSIAAGLDYPVVGPEHAYLKDTARATYVSLADEEALEGFRALYEQEGILSALEPSHAIFYAMQVAREMGTGKDIVINISGRGHERPGA